MAPLLERMSKQSEAVMTYLERSTQLALDASVLVQVILGDTPGDCELVPLKPQMADEATQANLKARWPGRGLRSVGFIGLVGSSPQCALKEPLEPGQFDKLASAFLAYLHALFADGFGTSAPIEAADVEPEYDWSTRRYRLVPRHS